ncbi:MAG: winged helix-turn-helix domain-containing protein [Terriglobales bacterium]
MATVVMQKIESGMPHNWPAGLLHLAALLSTGSAEMRDEIAALHREAPRLSEGSIRQQMQILCAAAVRAAADAFSGALGCSAQQMLQFAVPESDEPALAATNGVLHRLDRCWQGPVQYSLQAIRMFELRWPGPVTSTVLALQGRTYVDGNELGDHGGGTLRAGAELRLAPGAMVLLRRPVISILLLTAAEAGLDVAGLMLGKPSAALSVHTLAGMLTLNPDGNTVDINNRNIRLSGNETAALKTLLCQPGHVANREVLQQTARLGSERAIGRIMLGLRNKLGDGIINTIYGVGYVLEVQP